ncbi:CheR family methyltransferase [Hansschlegelia zhihuaiae]|uniref:protein-glutamate O-methyltransferase n=1 Tax=Hansschlegelia zhihuaiae TaxID=405005 RepID=A0A4Q0MP53_9HYPH|nr:CheR family methyltransferase [Hansschlegelia zhihuaiae]RXF75375.1 methyltransferase domain-containing protein [Hansschlegelia zhihuaiae]
MTPIQFASLARFLKERSGLVLGEDKRYLAEARLGPVARSRGVASLGALVDLLARGGDLDLAQAVTEAMTTNETYFFRDGAPFQRLTEEVLPKLIAARAAEKRLRFWSAACSSGQEAYSLAMLLAERSHLLKDWRVEIVATDLSSDVVNRAKEGLFSQFEVQRGLPIKLLLKHFVQEGDRWRIEPALRQQVQFRTLNLLRDFSSLGRFDVVFCRNVLIYFDDVAKADVLERLSRQIAPDGALVLGAAETTIGLTTSFQPSPGRGGVHYRVPEKTERPVIAAAALAADRPPLSVVGSAGWR